ncbi:exosomal 3'-to-5' phosphorolytic exoribonuclease Ski6 [Schizosaccharomyces octosporus yFS286]|uniref:Ribosomal RNA-processing protein 41 n=1 Tax=Schizosaccharomyces octosporus (strain yFS286) TaxID=483514 RepID=S9PQ94_SCHOY|nr:exosomal 3'-to-5' phosphorolytic exoribonuclease Ski6 [Schizosaccharomyces octosporus yFS286]EPX71401.1 exosomal 3'-to-5' phosphorolytic exoribonuclease Ski6 [Schizosaccharomyces octosporus yFS286]
MSLEILSLEGLRNDGRRWNEMRNFFCRIGVEPSENGSSIIQYGNTRVMCIINGPSEPTIKSKSRADRAFINVDINIAPFSTIDRKRRFKSDRRIQLQCLALQRTFEQVVQVELYPKSQVSICLHVLHDDGAVVATCMNAATLALMDAGIPMTDYVCCSTAGIIDSDILLDLNSLEESDLSWMTVAVMGTKNKVTYMQLETKMHLDYLESVMNVAIAGAEQIYHMMQNAIRQNAKPYLAKLV